MHVSPHYHSQAWFKNAEVPWSHLKKNMLQMIFEQISWLSNIVWMLKYLCIAAAVNAAFHPFYSSAYVRHNPPTK